MNKFESATINLNTGITLFFSNNLISSITLVGASHEVFDSILKSKSIENSVQFLSNFTKSPFKNIVNNLNKAKNWIKHADKDIDAEYNPNENDCIILIALSIPAYSKLGGVESEEIKRFKSFFEEWIKEKI